MLVALAEVEAGIIALEAETGHNVPDSSRPLSPVEVAAGVKFGLIDARIDTVAERLLAMTDPARDHILRALAGLDREESTAALQAAITEWAAPFGQPIPGLEEEVRAAADRISAELEQVWPQAAGEVRDEAVHQRASSVPSEGPLLSPGMILAIGAAALGIVTHRATRVLGVAQQTIHSTTEHTPSGAVRQAVNAARTVDPAGTRDLARQAVHQVQSAARSAQADAPGMPPIASVYASEILDHKTCDPCKGWDGVDFATLDDAHTVYRDAGGNRNCLGGLRCRGTLVFVFDTEQAPTLQVENR